LRGRVCLGQLDKAWYPALDLSELCQMLLDLAQFRNYDLFALVGEGDDVHEAVNFLDGRAAAWVQTHQEAVAALGGIRLPQRIGVGDGDDDGLVRPKVARNVIYRLG